MLKKTFYTCIIFLIALMFLFSCTSSQKKEEIKEKEATDLSLYQHTETKEIIKLVEDAVKLVEQEGEKAFFNFYEKDSKWFHDDTYIFVWGLDGMRYVYPRDRSGEGKNMLDLKDINDKPIGKMFVETAKSPSGKGWVFYEWTKPGEIEPIWKSTFIKRAVSPENKEYLVGCGKYNMPVERIFIEQVVNKAAKLLENKGKEEAFAKFNDKASQFIFLDTYVYIKDMEGNELVNPFFPELVGKNIMDLQDANGKYFVQEELEILETRESCWYSYMWPKPGAEKPSKKVVYVKKVELPAETLVVGAGYFPALD